MKINQKLEKHSYEILHKFQVISKVFKLLQLCAYNSLYKRMVIFPHRKK